MSTRHDRMLKEAIRRNWSQVLHEHMMNENETEEGLKDVGNYLKGLGHKVGEHFGFINPKRDEFIEKNKQNNIGPRRKGSKAVTAVNALGKTFAFLTGKKWNARQTENEFGGYLGKDVDYNHERDMYELEKGLGNTINTMLSYMCAVYLLSDICSGTTLYRKFIEPDPSFQHNSRSPRGIFIQFVNPFSITPEGNSSYGGNLQNGFVGRGATDIWTLSQKMSDLLRRTHQQTEKFFDNEQYEWLEAAYDRRLQEGRINPNLVNKIIKEVQGELNTLDVQINRLLWDNQYKTADQAQSDPQVQNLVQRKVFYVNNKIKQIVEMFKKKVWTAKMENGHDTLPWFFDLDGLYGIMQGFPMRTIDQFMQAS